MYRANSVLLNNKTQLKSINWNVMNQIEWSLSDQHRRAYEKKRKKWEKTK